MVFLYEPIIKFSLANRIVFWVLIKFFELIWVWRLSGNFGGQLGRDFVIFLGFVF